ncbi:MAG: hypothetical protein E6K04_01175 [Methanobacteriota archaeon]|nr:MAG: hypothetical protein E6K04_01175 [Euryarchaeota archaeon]
MGADSMKSKIVILGDGGVGKTSLIRRFVAARRCFVPSISNSKTPTRIMSRGMPFEVARTTLCGFGSLTSRERIRSFGSTEK